MPEPSDKELIVELVMLAIELDQALARERGGGSPLTRDQYLDLHRRVREVRFKYKDILLRK